MKKSFTEHLLDIMMAILVTMLVFTVFCWIITLFNPTIIDVHYVTCYEDSGISLRNEPITLESKFYGDAMEVVTVEGETYLVSTTQCFAHKSKV